MITRVLLIGRIRSGKDYIAEKLGYTIAGLGSPLYTIAAYFFGSGYTKADPGYRDFLRKVGQYGRGYVDSDYPLSVERALFVSMMRREGPKIFSLSHIKWDDYGKKQTFWAESVLRSPILNSINPQWKPIPLVIPDYRYEIENPLFISQGFKLFLVLCSEETRLKRIAALGESQDRNVPEDDIDYQKVEYSEKYSTLLSHCALYPDKIIQDRPEKLPPVIWNDDVPPPPHLDYALNVDTFVNYCRGVSEGD